MVGLATDKHQAATNPTIKALRYVFSLLCAALCHFYIFCNHLEEEERAGCFAFIVLQMSCYCECSVALPHGAVGSVVCSV